MIDAELIKKALGYQKDEISTHLLISKPSNEAGQNIKNPNGLYFDILKFSRNEW